MRKKEKHLKRKIALALGLFGVLYLIIQHNQQAQIQRGLPETFDLRNLDGYTFVTSVKDQKAGYEWWNNVGACWAHAALASLESSLLKQSILIRADAPDASFSPWYLATKNGYNTPRYEFNAAINPYSDPPVPLGYNAPPDEVGWGGSLLYAVDYLTRASGIVPETAAPWPVEAMTAKRTLEPPEDRQLQNYILRHGLIYSSHNFKSVHHFHAAVKNALMTHGAVATYIYMGQGDWPGQRGNSFWRDENFLDYYCDRGALAGKANHAVTIVGWDNKRKISGAPGPGAWLVKDSYGTDWHDMGYFWVSFFDRVFMNNDMIAVQMIGDVADGYAWPRYESHPGALSRTKGADGELSWDYLSDGFKGQNAASWGAARFTSTDDAQLTALGFMTVNPDEKVTLQVFSRWNEATNQPEDLLHAQQLTVQEAGYHVVDLSRQVPLWRGQEFVIAVGFDARVDARNEPLVVVIDPEFQLSPQRTFRNSYSSEAGFGVWEDFAVTGIDGGKTFYVQALVSAAGAGRNRI